MAVKKEVETKIRFWTPLRLVSTVIVLGLLAAFGVSSCNSNDPPTRVSNPNLPLLPAVVLDTELQAASGGPIKLSNYSGKVMLVNLWATWCGPCRMETPELVRLHKEYQDRVQFVGLSTEDPVASAQKVQEFIKQYEVDYQIGWATRDVALTLMQGKTTIPQSFIITRDGRLFRKIDGFHPTRTPPELRRALDDALL
jgi:thiol-disulfide isomerase/thioredoxin